MPDPATAAILDGEHTDGVKWSLLVTATQTRALTGAVERYCQRIADMVEPMRRAQVALLRDGGMKEARVAGEIYDYFEHTSGHMDEIEEFAKKQERAIHALVHAFYQELEVVRKEQPVIMVAAPEQTDA